MGKCKHDILKIKSEKKNQYEYAVAISIEEKENLNSVEFVSNIHLTSC